MIWKADIIAYDECIAFEFACEEGRKNVLDVQKLKYMDWAHTIARAATEKQMGPDPLLWLTGTLLKFNWDYNLFRIS